MFCVTVLGNNSAIPSNGRHPSCQILQIKNELYMIDCGEATQMQLTRYNIKKSRIDHIFISHLHGDHFFGLIGLINTYSLLRRAQALHIYCHEPLKEIIEIQLNHSGTILSFELHFHFIPSNNDVIFENDEITVSCIQLSHRIACVGFIFKEKLANRKLIKEQIDKYKVPIYKLKELKKGLDFIDEKGTIISNELLTNAPPIPKSYAYITDTCFLDHIIADLKNIDCLYHETTFKQDDEQRAKDTFHSTSVQAAEIAKQASVKKLLVGHFSAKYKDADLIDLLIEAKQIFEHTELTIEGNTVNI